MFRRTFVVPSRPSVAIFCTLHVYTLKLVRYCQYLRQKFFTSLPYTFSFSLEVRQKKLSSVSTVLFFNVYICIIYVGCKGENRCLSCAWGCVGPDGWWTGGLLCGYASGCRRCNNWRFNRWRQRAISAHKVE